MSRIIPRDTPVIFTDFDGVLATNQKLWTGYPDGNSGIYAQMAVGKLISDYDSHMIQRVQDKVHLVIISGDGRVNRLWACYKGIPFIHAPDNKWLQLQDYWYRTFGQRWKPEGRYYYIGDSAPDLDCMKNAKKCFAPRNCSALLDVAVRKLPNFQKVAVDGGQGVFEHVILLLVQEGVLPKKGILL